MKGIYLRDKSINVMFNNVALAKAGSRDHTTLSTRELAMATRIRDTCHTHIVSGRLLQCHEDEKERSNHWEAERRRENVVRHPRPKIRAPLKIRPCGLVEYDENISSGI